MTSVAPGAPIPSYLEDGREVWSPDVLVDPQPKDVYHPMRGFAYVLMCQRDGVFIGFVTSERLGFKNVKAYLAWTLA